MFRAEVVGRPLFSASPEVALKVVRRTRISKRAQHYLIREIAVHTALRAHPHVVTLFSYFLDSDNVYLVMELLRGGDVFAALKGLQRGLKEVVALTVIRQVLDALAFMHAKGIAHRDIKLENIVFAKRPNLDDPHSISVRVIDFGLAYHGKQGVSESERKSQERCGTVRYAAPEISANTPYVPEHADMWSAGVVLYTMIARQNPYNGKTDKEVKAKIDTSELVFKGSQWRDVSDATKRLIKDLLNKDPAKRPSAKDAIVVVDEILRRSVGNDDALESDGDRSDSSGEDPLGISGRSPNQHLETSNVTKDNKGSDESGGSCEGCPEHTEMNLASQILHMLRKIVTWGPPNPPSPPSLPHTLSPTGAQETLPLSPTDSPTVARGNAEGQKTLARQMQQF